MTITGGVKGAGVNHIKRVVRYDVDKNLETLPSLNKGRCQHACGKYTNSDGGIVSRSSIIIHRV